MLKMPMFVHIVDSLTAWPRVRFRKLAGNCVKITYVRHVVLAVHTFRVRLHFRENQPANFIIRI